MSNENEPCPILYAQLGEVHISEVLGALGLPKQDQECREGTHCYLVGQDISDIPELQAFIIELVDVEPFMKAVIVDPSQAVLKDIWELIKCPEWHPDLPGSN